jgi:hypothetical protein
MSGCCHRIVISLMADKFSSIEQANSTASVGEEANSAGLLTSLRPELPRLQEFFDTKPCSLHLLDVRLQAVPPQRHSANRQQECGVPTIAARDRTAQQTTLPDPSASLPL